MALITFLKEAVTIALQIRLLKKKAQRIGRQTGWQEIREAALSKARSPALGAFSFRLTSF
jgi:hypothetical protein